MSSSSFLFLSSGSGRRSWGQYSFLKHNTWVCLTWLSSHSHHFLSPPLILSHWFCERLPVSVPQLSHGLAFSFLCPIYKLCFTIFVTVLPSIHCTSRLIRFILSLCLSTSEVRHTAPYICCMSFCAACQILIRLHLFPHILINLQKKKKIIFIVFFCTYTVLLKQLSLFWARRSIWRQHVYPMINREKEKR